MAQARSLPSGAKISAEIQPADDSQHASLILYVYQLDRSDSYASYEHESVVMSIRYSIYLQACNAGALYELRLHLNSHETVYGGCHAIIAQNVHAGSSVARAQSRRSPSSPRSHGPSKEVFSPRSVSPFGRHRCRCRSDLQSIHSFPCCPIGLVDNWLQPVKTSWTAGKTLRRLPGYR